MNRTPVVLALLLPALMQWGGAAFALPHVDALDMPPIIYIEVPDTSPVIHVGTLDPHNWVIMSEATGETWVIEAERVDDDWKIDVDRDTVYLASATIVGLATFGSLMTVRVFGKPKTSNTRAWGFSIMFAGMLFLIVFQSILMYVTCCSGADSVAFTILFSVTVMFLVFIAIGFFLIVGASFKDEVDSSSSR